MNKKLFTRDFTLVVIGQIISLFGNATIRFALPLYLMNLTGSAALFGTVTACAFIPSVLVSPVGGIIADRINKRNIMVALDFFTAAVILLFSLLKNDTNVVVRLTVTLMLLYGIAGALSALRAGKYPVAGESGKLRGGKFRCQCYQLTLRTDRACSWGSFVQRLRA